MPVAQGATRVESYRIYRRQVGVYGETSVTAGKTSCRQVPTVGRSAAARFQALERRWPRSGPSIWRMQTLSLRERKVDMEKERNELGSKDLLDCPFCGEAGSESDSFSNPDYPGIQYGCFACGVVFDSPEEWNHRQSNATGQGRRQPYPAPDCSAGGDA